jgi:hypothetical protein
MRWKGKGCINAYIIVKKPVYKESCPEFKDWTNCFLELNGMHRFTQDPEWGRLLMRFCEGAVTGDDIDMINDRVVTESTTLPEDIKYATFFNRDRDSINAALFQERCKTVYDREGTTCDSILIFSDEVQVQNSTKMFVPFQNCNAFWENCGEDDVKLPRGAGRMDPVLRLYAGCRLMLPCNTNVKQEGHANGMQATLEKVVLKPGTQPHQILLDNGVPVAAILASQVSYIVVRHSNDRIVPPTFSIKPKQHIFTARILKPQAYQVKGGEREDLKMKAVQIPVLVNNASTGHKLQGSGFSILFVHGWSYVTNWVYVILSRVKTRAGLFLHQKLSNDLSKYAMPDALSKMLQRFREKAPTSWSDDDYD